MVLIDIMSKRYSCRSFSYKKISREDLELILKSGYLPENIIISSNNDLYTLRNYLNSIEYKINKEIIVYENGKYYDIISYEKGKENLYELKVTTKFDLLICTVVSDDAKSLLRQIKSNLPKNIKIKESAAK